MTKAKRSPPTRPGKQRTRAHIIADLSVNFVQRIILECGYTATRVIEDYGYDLIVETFDERGKVEGGFLLLQLKATDEIHRYERTKDDVFAFPLDARDVLLWMQETVPVLLILFDAARREGYWQHVQTYLTDHPPAGNTKTLTIEIPKHHVLGIGTIQMIRRQKNQLVRDL